MKKILASVAVFFMMLTFSPANAAVYSDVPADFWANKEISAVVTDGILPLLDKDAYFPDKEVSRSDFNSALLRTLGHKKSSASAVSPFSDVDNSRADFDDILLSSQLGLIYGYNDGTFKPDRIMTKAEAASVISHITKDFKGNVKSLTPFKDRYTIPSWANRQFAKTIDLDVYVAYPNADELLPNKQLDRAEAAVLLYKLKQKINAVKEQYVNKNVKTETEKVISTQHLDVTNKAEVDEVVFTNLNTIVKAKNIIKGYFYNDFSSKTAEIGEVVTFTAKEDVYTKEKSLVIPAGTKIKSVITSIEEKKWWNKNDKVTVEFESLTLPNGVTVPFNADIINNNGVLTENRWVKPLGYTLGGAVVGGGVGTGISAMSWHHHWGRGIGAGVPIGAGVGLITGLVTKGRTFNAHDGEWVWLELTQDLTIPNN